MYVLEEMHQEILSRVWLATMKAHKNQSFLKKYGYLRMDEKTEFMKQFLLHGQFLAAEELELVMQTMSVKSSTLQLVHFKEQIWFFNFFNSKDNILNHKIFTILQNEMVHNLEDLLPHKNFLIISKGATCF